MTTEEHLQKIKAKCIEFLDIEPYVLDNSRILAQAAARSTIAAIDVARRLVGGPDHAYLVAAIISAWPEELL